MQIDYFLASPKGSDNQCRNAYIANPQTQIITSTSKYHTHTHKHTLFYQLSALICQRPISQLNVGLSLSLVHFVSFRFVFVCLFIWRTRDRYQCHMRSFVPCANNLQIKVALCVGLFRSEQTSIYIYLPNSSAKQLLTAKERESECVILSHITCDGKIRISQPFEFAVAY